LEIRPSYTIEAFPQLLEGINRVESSVSSVPYKGTFLTFDSGRSLLQACLSGARLAHLQMLMLDIDQTLTPEVGLPGRRWYRNLIYAPGRLTGYGAKTLPGVREAIEDQRWADANRYAKLTADALNAYSDRLDKATVVLKGA
jgi:N-acetylated-alpha-linked acidic dipeptidase